MSQNKPGVDFIKQNRRTKNPQKSIVLFVLLQIAILVTVST